MNCVARVFLAFRFYEHSPNEIPSWNGARKLTIFTFGDLLSNGSLSVSGLAQKQVAPFFAPLRQSIERSRQLFRIPAASIRVLDFEPTHFNAGGTVVV
jgi:hypothetical protein